jgi:hypothetical protein
VGGEPLVPPPREKRRAPRKPKAAGEDAAQSGEEEAGTNNNDNENGGSKRSPKKAAPVQREPPFHHVIPEDVKAEIAEKGLKLVRNTVDLALGGSRIKLGQGGYASLIDSTCLIGEGSFTCDEAGNVTFSWERCMQLSADGQWQTADETKLMPSLSLADGKSNDRYGKRCPQISTCRNAAGSPFHFVFLQLLLPRSKATRRPNRYGDLASPTQKISLRSMASK